MTSWWRKKSRLIGITWVGGLVAGLAVHCFSFSEDGVPTHQVNPADQTNQAEQSALTKPSPEPPHARLQLCPIPLAAGMPVWPTAATTVAAERQADPALKESAKGTGAAWGRLRVVQLARQTGLDLQSFPKAWLVARQQGGQLFYLGFNQVIGPTKQSQQIEFIYQRIRKVSWARNQNRNDNSDQMVAADAPLSSSAVASVNPNDWEEVQVAYQVERFAWDAGKLGRPDQHYGSFHLGAWQERLILKTFQVGFGRLATNDDLVKTDLNPDNPETAYTLLQAYQIEPGLYEEVDWLETPITWQLFVQWQADGKFQIHSDGLQWSVDQDQPIQHPVTQIPATGLEKKGSKENPLNIIRND